MARCASSAWGVMRRLSRRARLDAVSRDYSVSPSLTFLVNPAPHSTSQSLDESRRPTIAPILKRGEVTKREDFYPTICQSGLLSTSPSSSKSSEASWNCYPSQSAWTIRASHRKTSSVPCGAMLTSYRGFTWGSKDDQKDAVLPTSPDLSTKIAEDTGSEAPVVSNWSDTAYTRLMESVKVVEDRVGEFGDVVTPAMSNWLDTHPVVQDIAIPLSVFTGAWLVLPRALRTLHRYVEQGSAALQLGPVQVTPIPYELSLWKAMETPTRLFATIFTMLQVGTLLAPNTMAVEYLAQFWAGGGVLCFVFFLHKWKSNVLKHLMTGTKLSNAERERYLTLDKFSSLALVFVGALGLAEAYGVALQSIVTVGGIGGLATAFAAKDILGNVLTGISLSFARPFRVGDTIKAGAVEGKVEELGLHSTLLLNTEKNPIIVPNTYFQSQIIVNKSRAPWRAMAVKIPIRLQDFEKVPSITQEIRDMLNRHPQVYLAEDKPRCNLAQFTPTSLDIAISCNINIMGKDEYLMVEQAILLEAARIITRSGAVLGERV